MLKIFSLGDYLEVVRGFKFWDLNKRKRLFFRIFGGYMQALIDQYYYRIPRDRIIGLENRFKKKLHGNCLEILKPIFF